MQICMLGAKNYTPASLVTGRRAWLLRCNPLKNYGLSSPPRRGGGYHAGAHPHSLLLETTPPSRRRGGTARQLRRAVANRVTAWKTGAGRAHEGPKNTKYISTNVQKHRPNQQNYKTYGKRMAGTDAPCRSDGWRGLTPPAVASHVPRTRGGGGLLGILGRKTTLQDVNA